MASKVALFLTVFCFYAVFKQGVSSVLEIQDYFFERLISPPGGMVVLSDRKLSSLVSCGVWCLSAYDNCTCFLYNITIASCSAGSNLSIDISVPVLDDSYLYVLRGSADTLTSSACPISSGFFEYTHNGNVACLLPVSSRQNYEDSEAICEGHGGFLITPKTEAKFLLMRQLVLDYLPQVDPSGYTSAVYIGIRSQNLDGIYRWEDDGSILADDFKTLAFWPGDPASADCGIMMSNLVLGDRPCNELLRYVCEHPL